MYKKYDLLHLVILGIMLVLTLLFLAGCASDRVLTLEDLQQEQLQTGLPVLTPAAEYVRARSRIVAAGGLSRSAGGLSSSGGESSAGNASFSDVADSSSEEIRVHVCGAVKEAGVVRLAPGSRAEDALRAAGGFTEEAATDILNLAAPVADGMQLYFPTREEAERGLYAPGSDLSAGGGSVPGSAGGQSGQSALLGDAGKVNLNTATAQELCTLPGVGETRAAAIIAYRREHGGFSEPEELMQISGIGERSFEKMKEYITVGR
ncbi:MAG: helix-hairpin-helix domain-containing protein [Lachnospiraceae bacterium]|nr:helix-hairpin-helix domain-containing protein [Lachnospiraceae bacterium]